MFFLTCSSRDILQFAFPDSDIISYSVVSILVLRVGRNADMEGIKIIPSVLETVAQESIIYR